ncbi:MAG: zinc-dependent metalloproteinase lipoprotein [Porphyromonas sp.]|nr:zinc-dependent metalloproteinase lipoprotein [Porphyromonas sp.]
MNTTHKISLWTVLCLLTLLSGSCVKSTQITGLKASVEELIADQNGNPVDTNFKTLTVVISSEEEWKVSSNVDWLSTNTEMGGISRTVVGVKVKPNITGNDRVGQLTFTTPTNSLSVNIKQLGGETDLNTIIYELPVVFHVLYNEADKNNTDTLRRKYVLNSADAQKMLEYINERYGQQPTLTGNQIYRGLHRKYKPTDDVYHLPKETNIRFVLASVKPDGSRMSPAGINAVEMDERTLDPQAVMSDKQGGRFHSMAWPIKDYINVYVFPFTRGDETAEEVVMGISHLPLALSSAQIDGLHQLSAEQEEKIKQHGGLDYFSNYNHCVVLNSDGFEWRTWRYTFLKADLARNTLGHELGHYLGLYHTFSEVANDSGAIILDSCQDTDYCTDTKSYNRLQYEFARQDIIASGNTTLVQINGLLMRNDCSSGRFESTNIMDYDYSYSDEFTPDQISRMRQVLYSSYTTPGLKAAVPRASGISHGTPLTVTGTPRAIPCSVRTHKHPH